MAWVLFLDLDAFFAAVELLQRPALRNEPVIVAVGHPGGRGVVSTATYAARRSGVSSGMSLRRALSLCPQAVVLPARHHLYAAYSEKVRQILHARFGKVEALSIDEACAELPEGTDPEMVAREVQERVAADLGLSCTIAVATNKLVAKVACDQVKPHGRIVIPQGTEQAFLAPLPVEKLPGVGPRTQGHLLELGVRTIGELAAQPKERLTGTLGKHGAYLWEAAHGIDTSPVQPEWEPKSIGRETTFERDLADFAIFRKHLDRFSREVAEELRAERFLAKTITVKLRYGNFETLVRQVTLPIATADPKEIADFALRLLRSTWQRGRPLRLIGLAAHGFVRAWPKRDAGSAALWEG
ncbi:DNA polymerase IV [Methylacidimicrobium sp. B4]|uniref:DNA polymerase IV n=1 Tax=Methylacidimicrobium sp. B4 TaxID=2796139 RepID=UPI001A8E5EB5|nr:DNA polymerase IV [Methylacidimicrobium sp. B4]QSR85527.1 DNA polymerase IV [Methylacidimicrobium sp. B4]